MTNRQSDEEVIADILLAWEEAFVLGENLSVKELCKERPDLIALVEKRIELLRSVSWIGHGNDSTGGAPDKPTDSLLTNSSYLAGRYQLQENLGIGGFGTVWRAFDLHLKRPVAVKLPNLEKYRNNKEARNRFLAEARRVAKLSHSGIVQVYDVAQHHDTVFIVSELVDGVDLSRKIKSGLLPLREVVRIIIEVANSIQYAHQHHYIHHDIKPSNLLIREDGRVFVTDFGISIAADDPVPQQRLYGTPRYMAPERSQYSSERIDTRSDIYSIGVVFYQLLTGCMPDAGNPDHYVFTAQGIEQGMLPPRSIDPEIPHEIERVCLTCLARLPADRFQTAQEIADLLTKWQIQQENGTAASSINWLWKVVRSKNDYETQERVQALLEDRTRVWTARPDNRLLPTLLQTYGMYWLTNRARWTPQQQKMLSHAGRYHAKRGFLFVGLAACFFALFLAFRSGGSSIEPVQEDDARSRNMAAFLFERLEESSTSSALTTIDEMSPYRAWVDPMLRNEMAKTTDSRRRLHASLGLYSVDSSQSEYLITRLRTGSPIEVKAIREALFPQLRPNVRKDTGKVRISDALVSRMWEDLSNDTTEISHRFRIACALSYGDSHNHRWRLLASSIAEWLMVQNTHDLDEWTELLIGLEDKLCVQMLAISHDDNRHKEVRDRANHIRSRLEKKAGSANTTSAVEVLLNKRDTLTTKQVDDKEVNTIPKLLSRKDGDLLPPPDFPKSMLTYKGSQDSQQVTVDLIAKAIKKDPMPPVPTQNPMTSLPLCAGLAYGLLRLLAAFSDSQNKL